MSETHRAEDFETGDRGAVAILVAASLLLLMGFAALTVDVGAAFSERRQDQSASDMAAMVALQFAKGDNTTQAATAGAAEARKVAESTLDSALTAADWSSCADPQSLAVVSTVSPCISFSANLQRSRVVIPTIDVATTFGRVVGIQSIATSAFAEAQVDLTDAGKVLPFGLFAGNAGSTEICLKTGPSGHVPPSGPCSENEDGNFGTLGISVYGNDTLHTKKACEPAHAQSALAVNMAVGVDHPLGIYTGTVRNDGDLCKNGPVFNGRPNQIMGQTGIGANLYDGMIAGVGPNPVISVKASGRIASTSGITVDSSSPRIDDLGLWNFIDPAASKPTSCSGNTNADMAACIAAWNASVHDPIFTMKIKDAKRFGAVPILQGSNWGHGKKPYLILDIVPVYIQSTWWDCTKDGCTIIHAPGDSGPGTSDPCPGWQETSCGLGGNAKKKIEFLTAFLLDIDMFPAEIKEGFPSSSGQVDYALVK